VGSYVALTLTNNLIAGHTVGVTNTQPASSTVTADTNLFWNTSDPITGTNGIRENPLLTTDYHLGAGSPAVNTGLDGNPRPQGGGYDIGAFEYVCRVHLPLVLRNL
jgi:hypothetical protein